MIHQKLKLVELNILQEMDNNDRKKYMLYNLIMVFTEVCSSLYNKQPKSRLLFQIYWKKIHTWFNFNLTSTNYVCHQHIDISESHYLTSTVCSVTIYCKFSVYSNLVLYCPYTKSTSFWTCRPMSQVFYDTFSPIRFIN